MEVYVAPEVREVEALHPYLSDDAFHTLPIRQMLDRQAHVIQSAHAAGDRRMRMHVMSWWPQAEGRTVEEVLKQPFTLDDARLTIAREYGYAGWSHVIDARDESTDPPFESAVDLMLAGDAAGLEALLKETPDLTSQRSRFGHAATLLHYLGANGVESHRQRTPMNAPALARLLVEHGADTSAEMQVYGGGHTALALASTSAHPHHAGVLKELEQALGG